MFFTSSACQLSRYSYSTDQLQGQLSKDTWYAVLIEHSVLHFHSVNNLKILFSKVLLLCYDVYSQLLQTGNYFIKVQDRDRKKNEVLL